MGWPTRHRRKLAVVAVLAALPVVVHLGVPPMTRIVPPPIVEVAGEPTVDEGAGLRMLGPAYVRRRGRILEVRLAGSPEEIGHQHGRLLRPEMVDNEGQLYAQFQRYVPLAPARWLIMDLARWQFREVDEGMPFDLRREIAAQASAFAPDPYADFLPTYHRFVFLQSLYDIALSFERSPLIGCTSFALTGDAAEEGHAVLARNFDFEAGPIFDLGKAVFLIREKGRIPYASVAWPGLVGVVSGMNAAGVAVVVHGGRARSPRARGVPVVHALRDVLATSRTTDEAVGVLGRADPMVSYLVMIVDAGGAVAVVERAPGEADFVRRGSGKVALTNHFEGPLADDPKNRSVEAGTSTLPRRRRLDELLENLPAGASVERIVAVLRDRTGVGGAELPLGGRRAIDALIATHGVVMDATARVLWVSEGPHLVGRFLRFDLQRLLVDADDGPPRAEAPVALAPDPIAGDGTYDAWERQGRRHEGAP